MTDNNEQIELIYDYAESHWTAVSRNRTRLSYVPGMFDTRPSPDDMPIEGAVTHTISPERVGPYLMAYVEALDELFVWKEPTDDRHS